MKRVMLSWSSGKDSAWALHMLRQSAHHEVVGLLTTMNADADRVAMHAVRRSLLVEQAAAAGLPLTTVGLPWPCSNQEYEALMSDACRNMMSQGIEAMAFADLFLTDVRDYRQRQLAGTGIAPIFPLWGLPTSHLARTMIKTGLRARLTCIDPSKIPAELVGTEFDEELLSRLPPTADPCGERGEFHTFCYAGPMFSRPIPCVSGEVVRREGFVFSDLLPLSTSD